MARGDMGRREGREKFWRGLIRRQRGAGGTVKKFCRRSGVSEPSFYAWRRRLEGGGRRRRARQRFVPVRVVGAPPTGGACLVEVVLAGGRVMRVRAGTEALGGIVRALEETPRCG